MPAGFTDQAPAIGDCDDADATRAPTLAEVCDSADNDCDGLADNGDVCQCRVIYDAADAPYAVCDDVGVPSEEAAGCRGMPGYRLVVVEHAGELTFLDNNAPDAFWLGLADLDEDGVLEWADGSPLGFEDFAGGEPNNAGGNERCVRTSGGEWNDVACAWLQPFVCEADPALRDVSGAACDDGDGDGRGEGCALGSDCDDGDADVYDLLAGWRDADGDGLTRPFADALCVGDAFPVTHASAPTASADCDDHDAAATTSCPCEAIHVGDATYFYCATPMSRGDANANCQTMGRALASVQSATANQLLNGGLITLAEDQTWLGLHDSAVEGEWRWLRNQALPIFDSWAAGEPNNGGGNEDCAVSSGLSATWNDTTCSLTRPSICTPPEALPECHALQHHWSMEDETTVDSATGLAPYVYGAPAVVVGAVGNGLSFDGVGDALRVADGPALELHRDFTVEAFVRVDPVSEAGVLLAKVDCGGSCPSAVAEASFSLGHDATGLPTAGILTPNDPVQTPTVALVGTTEIDDGQWHHLAMVRQDGANALRLYVDGVLEGEATGLAAGSLVPILDADGALDDLYLGAEQLPTAPRRFSALALDEVYIWGTALDGPTVAAHAAASSPLCTATALGYPPAPQLHACVVSPDELVVLHKAESSPIDATSGKVGQLQGEATYGAGAAGGGFDLTGSDASVLVSAFDPLQIDGDFTLQAWFRVPASSAQTRTIVGYEECGRECPGGIATGLITLSVQPDGRVAGAVRGQPPTPTGTVATSAAAVDDDVWHHVALVRDANADLLTLILDGVSVSTALPAGDATPLTDHDGTIDDLIIGAREVPNQGELHGHLLGFVDEVSLARRALSDAEIDDVRTSPDGYCYP